MWFKNLSVYKLSDDWTNRSHEIEGFLSENKFERMASRPVSTGWVPPREGDDSLVMNIQGQLLMAFRIEKKLLPSSVVNEAVKERAKIVERQHGFRPGRKQMKDMKEQIVDELLPSAFPVAKDIRVWIDPKNGWVVFDTASPSQADEITAALGKAMNPFPIEVMNHSHILWMTNWTIRGQPPARFTIDDESQWENDDRVIRYVRHCVPGEETQARYNDGFLCTRLGMTWNDKISFVMTGASAIKNVKPLDVVQQKQGADTAGMEEAEKFESDFVLMTSEFSVMLSDLFAAMED